MHNHLCLFITTPAVMESQMLSALLVSDSSFTLRTPPAFSCFRCQNLLLYLWLSFVVLGKAVFSALTSFIHMYAASSCRRCPVQMKGLVLILRAFKCMCVMLLNENICVMSRLISSSRTRAVTLDRSDAFISPTGLVFHPPLLFMR